MFKYLKYKEKNAQEMVLLLVVHLHQLYKYRTCLGTSHIYASI